MSIFEQFMRGRQFAQQQALNQMRLAQAEQLFPIEQQLKNLQLERERFNLERGQELLPLEVEQKEIQIEEQKALLERGLLGFTSGEREFKSLTEGMSQEDITQARRIKLGLDPRAVGSAMQTIAKEGTVKEVAATEKEIAAASEEGKLISQLNLKPSIEAKVTKVVAAAKADAEAVAEARSNNAAFNLYQTAIGGLATSLGQTTTGPILGMIPALTSEQQIADGAIAAMAPIMKQMFRAAGEGTFTDNDQALLMGMLPTRKDSPDARVSKMQNIDAIVRSKLKQPDQQPQAAQTGQRREGGQLMKDAQGNQAWVYPDGTFEEVQ